MKGMRKTSLYSALPPQQSQHGWSYALPAATAARPAASVALRAASAAVLAAEHALPSDLASVIFFARASAMANASKMFEAETDDTIEYVAKANKLLEDGAANLNKLAEGGNGDTPYNHTIPQSGGGGSKGDLRTLQRSDMHVALQPGMEVEVLSGSGAGAEPRKAMVVRVTDKNSTVGGDQLLYVVAFWYVCVDQRPTRKHVRIALRHAALHHNCQYFTYTYDYTTLLFTCQVAFRGRGHRQFH
jgi:hypothetical protein